MMLTAIVLICSVAITPDIETCSRQNAIAVIRLPAVFENSKSCFMHGQAYVADTSIAQNLAADERVKVVCTRDQ
jgi:hypothetical protein